MVSVGSSGGSICGGEAYDCTCGRMWWWSVYEVGGVGGQLNSLLAIGLGLADSQPW